MLGRDERNLLTAAGTVSCLFGSDQQGITSRCTLFKTAHFLSMQINELVRPILDVQTHLVA
jgi:hypothetical protein